MRVLKRSFATRNLRLKAGTEIFNFLSRELAKPFSYHCKLSVRSAAAATVKMGGWRLCVDWSKFDLAMTDPRYLHGVPVFKDEPRMPVQAVLDNLDEDRKSV